MLAVRLESNWTDRVRYMVVVYCNGRQDTEENILLGVDFTNKESKSCTIGMVLYLWSDTKIHLDGDGGFSINTAGKTHVFKPVSVQAMWSALQVLHKACEVARRFNYFPGGLSLVWATYYESCISSDQSCINEWNTMQDLESARADSPILFMEKPNEGERTELLIRQTLRSIMMTRDLENVTCKEIRNELEEKLSCNLKEYKEYIDNEMLLILGQMDKASLIFDHVYLGSEWNASNLEELHSTGVGYILNVTREIDNFFPGMFAYHNIRVYDEETTDLLSHWNDAYHFINKAKKNNSKCLVHCKMGVSRSASTVIAYAMKEYGWSMEKAYNFVKQKRSVTRPNSGFKRQLLEYEGILDASKQRHNKLWRQHVEIGIPPNDFDAIFPSSYPQDTLETEFNYGLNEDYIKAQTLPESYCLRHLTNPCGLIEPLSVEVEAEELERDALVGDTELPYYTLTDKENYKGNDFETIGRNLPFLEGEIRKKLDFEDLLSPKRYKDDVGPAESCMKEGASQIPLMPDCDEQVYKENMNSNSSKRSCPKDTEEDAIFGILSKVKPPYPSCTDCMYPKPMCSEVSEEAQQPYCDGPLNSTTVCSQPTLLQHMTSAVLDRMHGANMDRKLAKSCPGHLLTSSKLNAVTPQTPLENTQMQSTVTPEVEPFVAGGLLSRKDQKQYKDQKYLVFSKELEKPTTHSYLMQHQESIIQLQKAGLVRKHTKELERLKSEGASVGKEVSEEKTSSNDLYGTKDLPTYQELGKNNVAKTEMINPLDGVFQKTSTPTFCKLDQISSYTKDFLKTICYTPTSSSMSSNLTRSSSSDSIHSVRGMPGLVKQRTQEIETRMRLAGLTLSSPLKRSHSLAKLDSLTFSSEDLSCDSDTFQKSECKSAKLRDSSVFTDVSGNKQTPYRINKSANAPITNTETR
ncbi:protein phosphatase Slingshot homolog 1 isoform X2 [Xenopus laevis]|uniref:protein-serine/threonine phosphatase n=1 Tax=Xenopus laevis TaxID=8355 RepID=A0A8J0V7I2_XENLA|nr:protein phosphatase Slingshot homolog 1 isoform X2 [Xenopus laevis]